jgi:ketosteroid isomerase-like protein
VRPFAELEFVPQEIEAVGEHVATVAVVRGVGRLSGAPFEARVGHLFTLRDGRVLGFEVFDNPSDAFRAAGLMPDTCATDAVGPPD